MDYMQGVVEDYLTSGQGLFIIPECLIKLDDGEPITGRHWYCDVAAVDLRQERALLCEVTYAKRPLALHKRLRGWADNWAGVRAALERDYGIPADWAVLPQVFVLEESGPDVLSRAQEAIAASTSEMPEPLVMSLRHVARWRLDSLDSLPAES
jgi:hypothetical protein